MGVRRVEDLIAWQLAVEFKNEVYDLIARSDQRGGIFAFAISCQTPR